MDTMGAKHMSLYGYQRRTTPFLESLAENSTVYSRCFAPSAWTIPSHASMFTGLYPSLHGAFEGNLVLNRNTQQMGSALKMSGYRTFGISSNGLVSPAFGFCHNFDYFKDFSSSYLVEQMPETTIQDSKTILEKTGEFEEYIGKGINTFEKFTLTFQYIRETGRWREPLQRAREGIQHRLKHLIKPDPFFNSSLFTEKTIENCADIFSQHSKKEPPFFLFINFMETHEKYRPPLRYRQFSHCWDSQRANMTGFYLKEKNSHFNKLLSLNRNLYDDEIYYLDQKIKDLVAALRHSGIWENTVVIITSDHGEHFGEKGIYCHNLSLYNELIWVPLLIHFPLGTAAKGWDNRLVSLTDLYATVLDLVKCPLPRPVSSYSLLESRKREFALSQFIYPEKDATLLEAIQDYYRSQKQKFSPGIMAVVTESGKKIIKKRDGNLEVFDFSSDKEENNDLVSTLDQGIIEQYMTLIDYLQDDTRYNEAFKEAEQAYLNKKFIDLTHY
jgi:arylsulfatase A-like enzyme